MRRERIVRFLQRAVLFEVSKGGADDAGIFDAGGDPRRAAAMYADGHVDIEDTLEALRPGYRPAFIRVSVVRADPGRARIGRRNLAASGRRHLRAEAGVWRKHKHDGFALLLLRRCARRPVALAYAMKTGQVGTRWRHQGGQLDDKVNRIPFYMRGAIPPRGLDLLGQLGDHLLQSLLIYYCVH